MTDNIIQFPNPDEVKEDEEEKFVVAKVTVYSNGDVNGWLWDGIETKEQEEWIKQSVFDGVVAIGTMITELGEEYDGEINDD